MKPRVLLPVLACAVVVLFFAVQVVLQGPMVHIDHALTTWLAGQRQPWLTHLTLFAAAAHETEKVLGATALLAFWLFRKGTLRDLRLLAVVPFGMVLNVTLKHLFQRPRPVLDEPLVELATFSFPSGHAVASTVFYGALCAVVFAHTRSRVLRALAGVGGLLMVLLVTFSRVYLGAHYLSDVVAGVALGTLCVLLFLRYARR